MYCRNEKICNKCFGDLPYKLGIENVGLTFNKIGEDLKQLSMKSFHDSTVSLNSIDFQSAIIPL